MHTLASRVLAAAALSALATSALAQQQGRPGGRQGGAPSAEQFIARMMEQDANGDGKLSRSELEGPLADRLFESGDANGDGFLDSAELKTSVESFIAQRGTGQGRPDRAGAPGQNRPGDAIDRRGAPRADEGGESDTLDFHHGMEQAGQTMRPLRRSSFTAATRAADLENIGLLQQGIMAAKLDMANVKMAEAAKERFGDDSSAYLAEFRMTLVQTLMESLALEMAVIEGDAEAAKNSVAHIVQLQKEGHDLFQAEEEEDEAETPAPTRVRPATPRRPAGDL